MLSHLINKVLHENDMKTFSGGNLVIIWASYEGMQKGYLFSVKGIERSTFSVKMVYKRGWTQEWGLYPPPPPPLPPFPRIYYCIISIILIINYLLKCVMFNLKSSRFIGGFHLRFLFWRFQGNHGLKYKHRYNKNIVITYYYPSD